ncbi:chemotaxis protein CheW [Candidatus Uabimicrobium sp. HlEnr_7]|uniref:chemotaxis protein CheW n=1 Tax=Candidatus Uabimicrobium helgolandensis TaxID=3095367 RepID=UPI003557EA9F
MDEEDIKEIIDDFIIEATESIEQIDQDLVALEADPENNECLKRIFRNLHTIKGTANFLEQKPNFAKMAKVSHVAEDVLGVLLEGKVRVSSEIMDYILQAVDILKILFLNEKQGKISDFDIEVTCNHLQSTLSSEPPQQESEQFVEQDTGLDEEDVQEIIDDFTVESTDLLLKIDQDLVTLEIEPQNSEYIERIFRHLHTIKGTANFLKGKKNFFKMGKIAHAAEDVMDALRNNKLMMTAEIMDSILRSVDSIKTLFSNPSIDLDEDLIEKQLRQFLLRTRTLQKPKISAQQTQRIQEVLLNSIDNNMNETQRRPSALPQDTNIRVDTKRLDHLMNLVGELVLGRNQLLQAMHHLEDVVGDDFHYKKSKSLTSKSEQLQQSKQMLNSASDFLNFVTSELQMAVLKTRMQPIGKIFNRFNRTVRDLARELNKKVNLVIDGADTELDKSVIEEIGDPLIHLLRNAVDHGIETIDERQKKGKPVTGVIRLSAYHEGNQIIIRISDDGKGIDPEKVKAKALGMGIVSLADIEHVPPENLVNLVFTPGFSTAGEVTSISGRGIGMDVVKSNIEKLNGFIEISSEINKGSVFTIRLPLTLAIVQALKINVSNEIFAVPLSSVVETIRTYAHKIETVSGQEVIRFRKNIIPLIRLSSLFSLPKSQEQSDKVYVIITRVADQSIGLVVDKILGQQEIVVKSLGNILDNIPGISGACLAGDGRVILILDLAGVVRLLPKKVNLGAVKHEVRQKDEETSKERRYTILVVEDSKNERKRICKALHSASFRVVEAQDGREALGQLENYYIDLVLTDLEMPDIDGYEFARKIKKDPQYKNIPVIVISSHREIINRIKGMEVGIDNYFTKPCNDKKLIEAIQRLLIGN